VGVAYAHGPRSGFHYSFTFNGTYQIKNNQLSECAGKFGADCDNPTPKWKHIATLGLGFKNVDFTTRWRLIGATTEDSSTDILASRIPVVNYFDETVNIRANDKFTFTLGVLNVFDKTPPIIGDTSGATSVGGSTFPVIYDVLGRSFFARVTANF